MAEEIGLRVRLKMAVDRSEAERAAKETERVLKERLHDATKIKLGEVEMPKFVQDLRETLSAGPLSSRGLTSESGLANIFGKGAEGMVGKIAGVFIILEGVKDIMKESLDRLTEASPALRNITTQLNMAINQILRPMGDAIATLLRPLAKSMMEFSRKSSQIQRNVTAEYGELAGIFAGLGLAFAGLVGPIMIAIGNLIKDYFVGIFTALYDMMFAPLVDAGKWLMDAIKPGLDVLGNFGEWLFDELKKLFTFDKRDIKDWGGSIGDMFGSIIPKFASGGVVDRPTLALVGEAGREYIIPESRMSGASSGPAGASGAVTLVINGNIYGDMDLRRTIRSEIDDYYRSVNMR